MKNVFNKKIKEMNKTLDKEELFAYNCTPFSDIV